ncbi:MAG: sulfotransferase family 2 domain-containing protein [Chloroflexi bacterium]|nr:sulfotransferase family 2 domain-containing protein [Chloroflexota bacterium]
MQTGPLIFLHVPKTAGSTLHRIIRRHYRLAELYHTDQQPDGWLAFQQWPEAKRADIRLLMGHVEMGAAAFLPRSAQYFTMLRDPVARAISYYGHARRIREHYCYEAIRRRQMSLAEFANSGIDVMMDNGQTRMLAGVLYTVPYGELTPDHLQRARQNLETFVLVGLTERFDESLLLMRQLFGWRNIFYAERNVSQHRLSVDEAARVAVTAVNQYDQALVAYGRELFANQWATLGSEAVLHRFQRLNRLLRPLTYYGGEAARLLTNG